MKLHDCVMITRGDCSPHFFKEYIMSNESQWETLEEIYPEVNKMRKGNVGFDYLFTNRHGTQVRIELKWRNCDKVDITPAQERDADVITLHDAKTDDFYHMTMEEYLRIAKPHSALPSGHKGKSKEVSKKKFIDLKRCPNILFYYYF